MSRPTALTPEMHGTIARAIKQGLTREEVAAIAGITDRTLRNYLSRGQAFIDRIEDSGNEELASGDEIYAELLIDVRKAEAELTRALSGSVIRAAMGNEEKGILPDWRAAVAFLERRNPAWGRMSKTELTGGVSLTFSQEDAQL